MIKDLTSEQKHILLEEGTEPPGTSPLNYEKREGEYCCAGCGTKLFESKKKYARDARHIFYNDILFWEPQLKYQF